MRPSRPTAPAPALPLLAGRLAAAALVLLTAGTAPVPAAAAPQADARAAVEPLPEPSAPEPLAEARVLEVLDGEVAGGMAEADLPGVAVAVVQGGRTLAVRGYGLAEIETRRPVDPERTVFRVGSLSKTFTSSLVLAVLREHGEVDLDTDVRPFLGELPIRPPLERPLTLRQLLTHTAGFNEKLFGQHARSPADVLSLEAFLRRELPPRFAEPGEVIAYGDFHTTLVGLVLERLTGRSFDRLAEERLFGPLGMDRTTFRQSDLPAALEAELAVAYRGVEGRLGESYPPDGIHTTPAAGARTTASDMALYLSALLGYEPGDRVMPPGEWLRQHQRQFVHHPTLRAKGLGMTETRVAGRDAWYKDGQASGFHARILLVPELELALFSVHNRSILGRMGAFGPASRFHRRLGEALVEELAPLSEEAPLPGEGVAEPALPVPAPGFQDRAQGYEGTYRTTIASRHAFEELLAALDEIRVERSGDRLRIGGGEYVEVEPGLLQWSEGGSWHAAFRFRPDGRASHLFLGAGAYERLRFWETARFTKAAAAAYLVSFLAMALAAAGARYVGRRRGRAPRLAAPVLLLAALDLGFLLGFPALLWAVDVQELFYGVPWQFRLLLLLPVASVAPLVWLARRGLARGSAAATRSAAVAVLLVGVSFLVWLHTWNLLGWRF